MNVLIHSAQQTLTASSGSASGNTSSLTGILRQLLVNPATSTTTYDVSITNDQSVVILERLTETGTLNEEFALPLKGIYTVALVNASVDEAFTIQLVLEE